MILIALVIAIPNCINAVEIDDNTEIWTYHAPGESTGTKYTLKSLRNGTEAILAASHVFQNKMVFCISFKQHLQGTNRYYVTDIYNLEADKVTRTQLFEYKSSGKNHYLKKLAKSVTTESTDKTVVDYSKGLAYLLSFVGDSSVNQDRLGDDRSKFNYSGGGDDIQLALWMYLSNGFTVKNIRNFFEINNQQATWGGNYPYITISDKKIKYESKFEGKLYTNSSKKAYDLYVQAVKISQGSVSYDATAEWYKFRKNGTPNEQQDLLILKKSTITEKKPINLELYKVETDGKSGIKGAKITIKDINDNVLYDSLESTGKDGKFGEIKLETPAKQGTMKIKINETAPENYLGIPDDVILTITYKNGKVERNKCRNSK